MSKSEAQYRADQKWRASRVHRVSIDYVIEDYDRVATAAKSAGLPVGSFVRLAVEEKIRRDNPQA